MTMTDVRTQPRWKSIAVWAARILVAVAFFAAGGAKIYGAPMLVEQFEAIGLGQGFRYLTGALEVIGAILVLSPGLAAFGGLLLSGIMAGAIFTHLAVIGGSPVPAVVLLALSAVVAYAHREQLQR